MGFLLNIELWLNNLDLSEYIDDFKEESIDQSWLGKGCSNPRRGNYYCGRQEWTKNHGPMPIYTLLWIVVSCLLLVLIVSFFFLVKVATKVD